MINLEKIKLIDLLPGVLKKDKTFKAICEVLQKYLDENNELTNKMIILANIDIIEDENIIDHLAYQFHVDFYDNEMTIENKKNMIKNSIFDHMKKGTPHSIKRVIDILYSGAEILEWFEYDGKPYFFKINIHIPDKYIIDKETYKRALNLINNYKNTRSWLESLMFINQSDIIHITEISHVAMEGKIPLSGITRMASRETPVFDAKHSTQVSQVELEGLIPLAGVSLMGGIDLI